MSATNTLQNNPQPPASSAAAAAAAAAGPALPSLDIDLPRAQPHRRVGKLAVLAARGREHGAVGAGAALEGDAQG
jgi:hypothetical protein